MDTVILVIMSVWKAKHLNNLLFDMKEGMEGKFF